MNNANDNIISFQNNIYLIDEIIYFDEKRNKIFEKITNYDDLRIGRYKCKKDWLPLIVFYKNKVGIKIEIKYEDIISVQTITQYYPDIVKIEKYNKEEFKILYDSGYF